MQREKSGILFRNTQRTAENQPNMRGEATIDGKAYEIAGWTKESEKAGKFLSLSFKLAQAAEPAAAAPVPDEEIPW